jgi:hypothetical protein
MNEWRISEALLSVRRLEGVVSRLTTEELVHVIKLEEASGRRKSLLDRLYRQQRRVYHQSQSDLNKQSADHF